MIRVLREAFDYHFSRLDPTGAHIDPPSVAVFEPLIAKGPDWGPHPLLATEWVTSSDRLRWRFRLRTDARFHSGLPCDAQAVVAAFEFLRCGMSEADDQLWYWDPVKQVSASRSDTVEVELHYPYARLPSLLWNTASAVYNESLRLAEPAGFGYEMADGTGPYRLVSWSPDRVVAERWEEYPTPVAPFLRAEGRPLERIEWVALTDATDRLSALEDGSVHCMHGPPFSEIQRLVDESRFEVVQFPQQSSVFLAVSFEVANLRFDNVQLRRALSLAIDREAIVHDVLHGHGYPSYGGVPRGDEFYDPSVDHAHRHDVVEAVRLLGDLGFRVGEQGVRELDGTALRVRCICQDDGVMRAIAEAVRHQLAGVGVALELDPVEPFAPFYEAASTRPPAVIGKWLWPDTVDALIGFTATRGFSHLNWQRASIPALDAAYVDWLRAEDDELKAAASRVQAVIATELPNIPLVTPNDVWVHDRSLRGYRPFKANLYPFYQPVRFAPESNSASES